MNKCPAEEVFEVNRTLDLDVLRYMCNVMPPDRLVAPCRLRCQSSRAADSQQCACCGSEYKTRCDSVTTATLTSSRTLRRLRRTFGRR